MHIIYIIHPACSFCDCSKILRVNICRSTGCFPDYQFIPQILFYMAKLLFPPPLVEIVWFCLLLQLFLFVFFTPPRQIIEDYPPEEPWGVKTWFRSPPSWFKLCRPSTSSQPRHRHCTFHIAKRETTVPLTLLQLLCSREISQLTFCADIFHPGLLTKSGILNHNMIFSSPWFLARNLTAKTWEWKCKKSNFKHTQHIFTATYSASINSGDWAANSFTIDQVEEQAFYKIQRAAAFERWTEAGLTVRTEGSWASQMSVIV